jgi:hypothetical protein
MKSFIYPRTVSVYRSKPNSGPTAQSVGLLGYSGREDSELASDAQGLTLILEDVPVNIGARGAGRVMSGTLPSDATRHPQWRILTKKLDRYAIRDNDIVVDDQGYRYQVTQNYWTPMGFRLDTVRLEA